MQLLVFVTEDDGRAKGPTLFVPDDQDVILPPHPQGLDWWYLTAIDDRNEMLEIGGRQRITLDGYFISNKEWSDPV